MKSLAIVSLSLVVMALPGCGTLRERTMPDEDNLLSGAGSIVVGKSHGKAEDFEQIIIEDLLSKYGFSDPKTVSTTLESRAKHIYLRNEMQDQIIAASNQRCGTFIRILISSKNQTRMGWSGISTLLTSAASVVSPTSLAKALSAGSAVSNSVLSNYNQSYFNDLALNVITSGITIRRDNLLKLMTAEREKEISAYPANRAIADAIGYHSACSIVSGLEAAAQATKANPAQPASTITNQPGDLGTLGK